MTALIRGHLILTLLVAVGVAILSGLGLWQVQRMGEKRVFLDRLAGAVTAAPEPLPPPSAWAGIDLTAQELRRVSLAGEWIPGGRATVRVVMPEMLPGGLAGGFGRFVIQALRLDGGGVVLVNRGFVPEVEAGRMQEVEGRAELTGLLRGPERANAFSPAGDTARRDFHLRDPRIIAPALGLDVAPFMVEAERRPGAAAYPVGVDPREMLARIPNNHLTYAATWFGLALTLIGVFAAYLVQQRRGDDADRGADGGADGGAVGKIGL